MAGTQGGSREIEVIDIQLKSLVSEINAKKDEFEVEDDNDPPSPPLPTATIGKSISSNAATLASFGTVMSSIGKIAQLHSQGTGDKPFFPTNALVRDAGNKQGSSTPIGPNVHSQSSDQAKNQGPNRITVKQNGSTHNQDTQSQPINAELAEVINTIQNAGGDSSKITVNTSTLKREQEMDPAEAESRSIAVAGFVALNGQGALAEQGSVNNQALATRKSIRKPKKRMIQDFEYSNALGEIEDAGGEEVEEEPLNKKVKQEVTDEEKVNTTEIEDKPAKKQKKGRKGKKKAAKKKLKVDDVYESGAEEDKGDDVLDDDLDKDLMKVRMLKCNKCDKHFLDRTKLRQHQKSAHKPKRVITEEMDYHCSECGKIFKRREHWRRHKEVHQTSRPHICITCGKGFKRLDHVKRHQSVHFTDKPFPCDECEKSFTRRDHLAKHKLLHLSGGKVKPFSHKKSRKIKKDNVEENDKDTSTSTKGSRKRKITMQLKARLKEEDFLDEKEAQSSDFLSSEEEAVGSPKKEAAAAEKGTVTESKGDEASSKEEVLKGVPDENMEENSERPPSLQNDETLLNQQVKVEATS